MATVSLHHRNRTEEDNAHGMYNSYNTGISRSLRIMVFRLNEEVIALVDYDS